MFDRFVAFRARQSPHAVAVSMPSAELSFAQLDAAVSRIAAALAVVALPGLAAVRVADPYLHWLVVLGLARLGVASASVAVGHEESMLAWIDADLVIGDFPAPEGREAGWFHISEAWAGAALRRAGTSTPRVAIDPDATGRVVTSSGATGLPKQVPLSWRTIDSRVMHDGLRHGASPSLARTLSLVDAGATGFILSVATWAAGGTLVLASRDATILAASLASMRLTTLLLSPLDLGVLLEALPSRFLPLPGLHLLVAGSPASLESHHAARMRLTPDLAVTYGSAETGTVSEGHAALLGADDAARGWVLPWYEVSVTDEEGNPLPVDRAGHIWVRGSAVVESYRGDSEATERHFRDGWYRSGDIGAMAADGALRVQRRPDEGRNLGVLEMQLAAMEVIARSCPGVSDAAAFARPDAAGIDRPWIAIVRAKGSDSETLAARLQSRLSSLPPARITWQDRIPRTTGGKADHNRLRLAVKDATQD